MPKSNAFPPIIFTCDGWIMGAVKDLSRGDLREQMIDGYAGTGGAFGWSIGDHEVYHFETKVGEILGDFEGSDQGVDSFVHSTIPDIVNTTRDNVRNLTVSCGGPMTALVDLCSEAGIPFFPRIRMNSHYLVDVAHPGYGRFRRENPHLLIGRPEEELAEGTVEYGLRTGKNYAFPEVREYMKEVIFECFERWDVDGIELDFMRHPGYFRIEEAFSNRYLMTDLVQVVREKMLEVGRERSKKLTLIVRVPPTVEDSTRVGLDVVPWIEEELIDIVVVGGGFIPFETPVDEFVEAAKGADCLVYGCIEATRYTQPENLRALAYRWWQDGADGIYLYNFYTMSGEWNKATYDELSDPIAIARMNKRYELDLAGPFFPCSGHGCGFRYASPSTQMPVVLDETTEAGPVVILRIADDIERASKEGALKPCGLRLVVNNLTAEDELEVLVNGDRLPWEAARVCFDGWTTLQVESTFWGKYPTSLVQTHVDGTMVEFDLETPLLAQGENRVEVKAKPRAGRKKQVAVQDIRIDIRYKDG